MWLDITHGGWIQGEEFEGSAWPGAGSTLARGNWDGFIRWITKGKKNPLGTIRVLLQKVLKCFPSGHNTVVILLSGTLDTIKKRRDVDRLDTGVHEAMVH